MKILIYTQLPDKSPKTAASKLGINPFFVKDFDMASKKYSVTKLVQIISFLREYDLKSKGVGSNLSANEHGSLYKELIFKILH
jgi:DNA polymerase-3 subunit delta